MENKCVYCGEYTAEICPACAGKGHQDAQEDELKRVGKVIKKLTNEDNISDSIDPDRDNFFLVENYLDSEELKKELGINQVAKGRKRE